MIPFNPKDVITKITAVLLQLLLLLGCLLLVWWLGLQSDDFAALFFLVALPQGVYIWLLYLYLRRRHRKGQ